MNGKQITAGLLMILLAVPVISGAQAGENNMQSSLQNNNSMSTTENNKEVIRKVYEEALNKRQLHLLDELVSEDFIGPTGRKGAEGFREGVSAIITALPDAHWHIEELIGEGSKVFIKWRLEGTQQGKFQFIAPTGKKVSNEGMGIFRLKDGKVIAAEVHTDRLGFLQELGIIPQDLRNMAREARRNEQVIFIDEFVLPMEARKAFLERANNNRNFIRQLPGFVKDAAYEREREDGKRIFITVAVWEHEEALKKAKELVLEEYKRQGFDTHAFLKQHNIVMERGEYREVEEMR